MIALVSKHSSYRLKKFKKKNSFKKDRKIWKWAAHLAYFIMIYKVKGNHSIVHDFLVGSQCHIQTNSGDIDF